jgi:hypothetical protein
VIVTFDHRPRRDHLHNQNPSVASTGIRRGRRAAGTHQAGTGRKDQIMNPYRTAALAAAACPAAISLAACTVTSTASPAPNDL